MAPLIAYYTSHQLFLRFEAAERRDAERLLSEERANATATATADSEIGDGDGDRQVEPGTQYNITDMDSGRSYSCISELTALVPDHNCEVPYSLAYFFNINQNVIREIIHIGLQDYSQIPRAVDSFDYVRHRSNSTFTKWLKLMEAIGFYDFDVEIAKFQEFCKGLVDGLEVTDRVACCCTDFIINEFLNYINANRYWFVKGNRSYLK